ncbi:MAG: ABC transporter ATP-binding protein, partial [Desulfobacterales bacterium]|nr:ABC transporter ATP-binding protein [Desulfobacterales bacterium]
MTDNRYERTLEMIQICDLTVGYDKKSVVSNINQEISKGEFISLLGPNGSGKTTILRTLSRLLSPIKGVVKINGLELDAFKQSELAKTLSVVLTQRINPGLVTTREFVALGRYPHTGFLGRLTGQDKLKTDEALKMVNAIGLADRYFGELSDGEKQKIVLARALAQEPEIMILDEPTLHLDLKHKIEVMSILQKFCREKGITVIVSLHDVDIALRVSDKVIMVKNGKIMGWGPPEDVLETETISALYDLDSARFNKHLGTIEVKSDCRSGSVYVAAGGGKATGLFRLLAKHGFNISTGIIHENDIDFHVARGVGAEVVAEKPFVAFEMGKYIRAVHIMEKADHIVDTGVPVHELNKLNADVIRHALKLGKKVFTI